jgi:GMP synthase-like glutamine amidotransferase
VRALVIGHDHIGDPGLVGQALEAAGWSLHPVTVVPADRFHAPDVDARFPDPAGWDLVVTLGAPWPRSAISTWAPREVELLARAHRRGIPVLGICAGAQFLAEALDGGCEPMGSRRLGWHGIRPDVEGIPVGPWFQWHTDRITVPPDAEVLADGPDGPEVFRVGRSVGVQFHPEMSAALLDRWLGATPLPADRAAALRREAARYESGAADRAERLLRGIGLLRGG